MVIRASRAAPSISARATVRNTGAGKESGWARGSKDDLGEANFIHSRSLVKEREVVEQHHERALFVDAEEMKKRIKENMNKPKYNVADLYHEEGFAQAIARHYCFEQVGLLIISLNALWIAIDTDYNKSETLHEALPIFQVAENFFCIFFLLEWITRFLAFKVKLSCLRDAWFVFDGSLVALMVLETWVLTLVLVVTGVETSSGLGGSSVLRLVRLFRLTRMARMARLLRAVPELMILIKGIVTATRSVFFTLCLLVSVIYVFGIAFVQLTRDTYVGQKYFDTVALSMFTLLLRGTYLDEITELLDDVREQSVFLVILFLCFVLLAAQTVTNMLIGVLCEVVSIVAATEKEEMMMTFVVSKMGNILNVLDYDKDDHISKKEFMEMLTNHEATRTLQEVGVDPASLVDFVDVIFASDDGEETALSFLEFMDIILQYRGSNTATVKDVVESQKIVRNILKTLAERVINVETLVKGNGQLRTSSRRGGQSTPLGHNGWHDENGDGGGSKVKLSVMSAISDWNIDDHKDSFQLKSKPSVVSSFSQSDAMSSPYRSSMQSEMSIQLGHSEVPNAASGHLRPPELPNVALDMSGRLRVDNYELGRRSSNSMLKQLHKQIQSEDNNGAAPKLFSSESEADPEEDNREIEIYVKSDRGANILASLQAEMDAIQRRVMQGQETLHRILSQYVEHEQQLKQDAAKYQSQASSLHEENCQLRDLLGNARPDASDEQTKASILKKHGNGLLAVQQDNANPLRRLSAHLEVGKHMWQCNCTSCAPRNSQRLVVTDTSADIRANEEVAGARPLSGTTCASHRRPSRPNSATSVRSSASNSKIPGSANSLRPASAGSNASIRTRQAIADSPDDDRLEFFSAPIDTFPGRLPPNLLPQGHGVPGQTQNLRSISDVYRPADVGSPPPPETPAAALPLRRSDRQRLGQQDDILNFE